MARGWWASGSDAEGMVVSGSDAEGRDGGERKRCRGKGWWASGASSVPVVRDCEFNNIP